MYLALPTLQTLPVLAKYAPRVSRDGLVPKECREMVDSNLKNALEAQGYAWQVVDLVHQKLNLAAPWLPIAVFYASLVVWRASALKLGGAGQGSRKILLLFREEIDKMRWPCCRVMVATLDNMRA
ncbi:hypothetical protein BFJ63_vAg16671 [Fusarium oxysporum f. sp. narcissi]|uniref:Uncharacterized protein n=1 Tax=Fusarium oxysporum f. sp. narcissi TaxID=451672 RepID=A0A4Q2V0P9_FUSOX|nr:hypothetical protein BFJ63_vAg16671 [Fusarium oxysporum f. sp. narcissi]